MTVSRFMRAALLSIGLAFAALTSFAAGEPTIAQIYDAAKTGKVEQAQQMIEQVLRDHPKSAKAHYVQAELFGVQGRLTEGQQELAKAEALDPGLPFAKPQAVSALRERLKQGGPNASVKPKTGSLAADAGIDGVGAAKGGTTVRPAVESAAPRVEAQASHKGFNLPWGTLIMIGAGLAALFLIFRRKPAQTFQAPAGGYPMGAQPAGGPYAGGVAQPGGGSNIMGGLATGLAVGAGVLAATEIGRRVFSHDDEPRTSGGSHDSSSSAPSGSGYLPMDANADMGGNDFGISDAGSWDSGGSSDSGGGGGDWD